MEIVTRSQKKIKVYFGLGKVLGSKVSISTNVKIRYIHDPDTTYMYYYTSRKHGHLGKQKK